MLSGHLIFLERAVNQFEVLANIAFKRFGLSELVKYKNEKIGNAHYEYKIIPHFVSAIVDSYWNTREY